MSTDFMRYNDLVQEALRTVVRRALERVRANGLPGEHHMYIAFRTRYPGVVMPEQLMERYPDEMTIVLQHQFWDLDVQPDRFEISLSFDKVPARLVVPFSAMTGFFDPSVQFGLQFRPEGQPQAVRAGEQRVRKRQSVAAKAPAEPREPAHAEESADVVSLDSFRKK